MGEKGLEAKTGHSLELWQRLNELLKKHRVTARWVEGHAGMELNERADKIAVLERDKAAGKQAVLEPKKEEGQVTRTEELEKEIEELKERLKLLEDERERLLFKEETKFEERL